MKQLIRKILREQEEEVIQAPPFAFFNYGWNDVLDWADGKLFRMDDDIKLSGNEIKTLGGLVEVSGSLFILESNIESFGDLVKINGSLVLLSCYDLETLGKLKSVSESVFIYNCNSLESLGALEDIGRDFGLEQCNKITTLGKLNYVGSNFLLDRNESLNISYFDLSSITIKGDIDIW